MFELVDQPSWRSTAGTAVDLTAMRDAVGKLSADGPDGGLIDVIAGLERLKSACAAAQARLTSAFAAAQSAAGAAAGVQPDVTRRSVAGQVGLARRDSRFSGARHVGAASALVADMPSTLAALARGDLSERRARILVVEWACLTPTDRRRADQLLAAELAGLGDRAAQGRAAAVAARLDPEAVLGKIRGAVKDRHVSLRPAPDTMGRLSALLPVAQGVAVYAALRQAADSTVAAPGGDRRSRGQIMADTLVGLVTGSQVNGCDPYGAPTSGTGPTSGRDASSSTRGRDASSGEASGSDASSGEASGDAPALPNVAEPSTAAHPGATGKPACTGGCGTHINLLMTDRALLGGDEEPAHLAGHGPIPAALARALIIGRADNATRTWVRRLYTEPTSGQLVAMDSTRRLFPPAAQRFLIARDQMCRTPWCDAPIRHIDHVTGHAAGGPTDINNGQGLCQACNHTKQAPHWYARADPDGRVTTSTPTGHTYQSLPPPPPASPPWPGISTIEAHLAQALLGVA